MSDEKIPEWAMKVESEIVHRYAGGIRFANGDFARALAKTRADALREAADECLPPASNPNQDCECRAAILALIDKEPS